MMIIPNFVPMVGFRGRLRKGIVSRARSESSREQPIKSENIALLAMRAGQGIIVTSAKKELSPVKKIVRSARQDSTSLLN